MAKDELDKILTGLEQYLATEKLMGRTRVELDRSVLQAVGKSSLSEESAPTCRPQANIQEKGISPQEDSAEEEVLEPETPFHFDLEGNQSEPPLLILLYTSDKPTLELLRKMVKAMGFDQHEIGILCMRSASAARSAQELKDERLTSALLEQIGVIHPKAIIGMGAEVSEIALGQSIALMQCRGKWFECAGCRLMPTYSLEQVLQDETLKRPVWNDLQLVMHFLEKQNP
jgi:uracil-DNA glycosylase family 4